MPINPNLLSARLVVPSNACTTGDVVVDGRKLTEKQVYRLYVVIGRVLIEGSNLSSARYAFLTNSPMVMEQPCIDIIRIGSHSLTTINRISDESLRTAQYHVDADGYDITDIFLPATAYDSLIERINAD